MATSMKSRGECATLGLLFFGLSTGGCSSDDGTQAQGGAGDDFAAFDSAMEQFVAERGLRGASAVLVQKDHGIVHSAGYGEFSADRTYLIMSSSKILSVGVLMRLADQGLLDLDAPIGTYVADWGTGKPELTLAELVSGSSGLPGIVDNLLYAPYACMGSTTETLAGCGKAIYTADDAAERIPPDTEFHYGGAPWQLAGSIAEAVAGKSWAELVDETYASCAVPSLGYTNASTMVSITPGADGSIDFSAIGYPPAFDGDASALPGTENPSIEGGVYATVEDYGKLLFMHLNGGLCDGTRVLSEAAVTRMQQDRVAQYGGSTEQQMRLILAGADPGTLEYALELSGYGMGWWVNRTRAGRFFDPGAFGSQAWLNLTRGYGAFIAIEGNVVLGAELSAMIEPVAEAAFPAQ
jgi:CubicO group peptidase (beta-lactamase class C family)